MEGYVKSEKVGESALRGKNCDMSTLLVMDPTLAAGEAGEGGVNVKHCPSD